MIEKDTNLEIIKPAIGIIEAEKLEKELIFDYRIPLNVIYTIKKDVTCEICNNEELVKYISQFIVSDVPEIKILKLIKLKFNIMLSSEIIEKHKDHIICEICNDRELQNDALNDIALIESDIVQKIDNKKVIESQIRQLYAMELQLKKEGDYSTALQCSKQLQNWIKMKEEIYNEKKEVKNLFFGDLVNTKIESTDSIIFDEPKSIDTVGEIINKDEKTINKDEKNDND